METMPLVSVPVITYNSSKTILETLESIKAQTYQNIELIISDDCSTDKTVRLCEEWFLKNGSRFARVELLKASANAGISANGNKARRACRGEWIKGIAGDDILMPKCIERFVEYVQIHTTISFIFCGMSVFGGKKSEASSMEKMFDNVHDQLKGMTTSEQLYAIKHGLTPPAPALFYNKEAFDQLSVENNEVIKNLEDVPKWINILEKGIRLEFLDDKLVMYRLGGISTQGEWCTPSYFKSLRQLYFYYMFEDDFAENRKTTIDRIITYECKLYGEAYRLHSSVLFRIAKKVKLILRLN